MNFGENRNLLFGVLALQMRGVPPEQLARCAAAWATGQNRELSEFLVEAGLLSAADCASLNRLVDEAIKAHAGDVQATLEDFGGASCIERTFQGQISFLGPDDPTVEQTRAGIRLGEFDDTVHAVEETPGRYTSLSEHARGGMGRVLLVYDEHLGRQIAMKELLPYVPQDGDTLTPRHQVMTVVSRFLQEARITGQLEHPSIVPVYELGRHRDGSLYYTMKLVRGRTMSEVIRSTSSLEERLAYLPNYLDLCQAIAYAHSRGVIHRDIKPGNVMIGEFGETVVLDWGLAKTLHDTTERPDDLAETLRALKLSPSVEAVQTSGGQILGTPVYMAPEQARGELDLVNERSDVYSLGAVLYELLTGSRPYDRGKPAEVLQKVITAPPQPVSRIEPSAPQELVAVCDRAMARDRRDRYRDAKELATEIQRFQTGAVVSAYRYSLGEYLRRWIRRHKAVAGTVAGAALLILAISTAYVISLNYTNALLAQSRQEEQNQRVSAESARDLAEQRQYVATVRLADQYVNSRLMEKANEVLWSAPEAYRNWEWGYLLNRSNEYVFALPDCVIATYSPDGRQIATLSRREGVRAWDGLTGNVMTAFREPNPERHAALRFSPDGARIAAGGMSGVIKVWRTDSDEMEMSLGPRTGVIGEIRFSPDGRRLVATASDGNAELWDLAGGTRVRTLPGGNTRIWRAEFNSDGSLILTSHTDDVVRVWSESSEEPLLTLTGTKPQFRPGTHDVVLIRNAEAIVYNGDNGQETGFRIAQQGPLRAVHYNDDGSLLLAVGNDGTSTVYEADAGSVVTVLKHGRPLADATFSPDATLSLTYTEDGSFKVWRLPTGVEIADYTGHAGRVGGAQFSPDNIHFLSLGSDGAVFVWNAPKPLSGETLADLGEPAQKLSIATRGSRIVLTTSGGLAHVFERETGTGVAAFTTLAPEPAPVAAISPDGQYLATAIDEITPLVWNVDDQSILARIQDSSEPLSNLLFSPDATRLTVGYWGGAVRTFDVSSGKEVARLEGHSDQVTALAYLPDGSRIVTASQDSTAAVWDTATGKQIYRFAGHTEGITAVAISPDASEVLTASLDQTIRAWNLSTGEGRRVLTTPDRTSLITYMGSSSRICTGVRGSSSARIWMRSDGQELLSLDGRPGTLSGMSYDATGSALLTANSDGTLRVQRAAPWHVDSTLGNSQQQYSAYHSARKTLRKREDPYTGAGEYVLAAPRPSLALGLSALFDAFRESVGTSPTAMRSTLDGTLAPTMEPLGLRAGDSFEAVNNFSLGSPDAALRFKSILTGIEQGVVSTVDIRFIRNRVSATIRYHALDIAERTDNVELSLARIEEDFEHHQATVSHNWANIVQVNNVVQRRLAGVTPDGPGGVGFLVMEGVTPDDKKSLSDMHLEPGDRIASIDGVPIISVEVMNEQLARSLDRLRSGDFSSMELLVMRGAFQRIKLVIQVVQ